MQEKCYNTIFTNISITIADLILKTMERTLLILILYERGYGHTENTNIFTRNEIVKKPFLNSYFKLFIFNQVYAA